MLETHVLDKLCTLVVALLETRIPHKLVAFVFLCNHLYTLEKVGHDLFIRPVANRAMRGIHKSNTENRHFFDYDKASSTDIAVSVTGDNSVPAPVVLYLRPFEGLHEIAVFAGACELFIFCKEFFIGLIDYFHFIKILSVRIFLLLCTISFIILHITGKIKGGGEFK